MTRSCESSPDGYDNVSERLVTTNGELAHHLGFEVGDRRIESVKFRSLPVKPRDDLHRHSTFGLSRGLRGRIGRIEVA